MSLARIQTVNHANKDQGKCAKCGVELPKGSAYRWYKKGFRSRYKNVRCLKPSCTPRPSELESSMLADVYSAMESAEDELMGLRQGDPGEESDITAVLEAVSEAASDTAQAYRDADEMFGGGGSTESGERADSLEEYADSLNSVNVTFEPEPCEKHADTGADEDCEACQQNRNDAWAEAIDEVESAVSDASF